MRFPIEDKCQCRCLWLSESYTGYDTICGLDGRSCSCVTLSEDRESYLLTNLEACKRHRQKAIAEIDSKDLNLHLTAGRITAQECELAGK